MGGKTELAYDGYLSTKLNHGEIEAKSLENVKGPIEYTAYKIGKECR